VVVDIPLVATMKEEVDMDEIAITTEDMMIDTMDVVATLTTTAMTDLAMMIVMHHLLAAAEAMEVPVAETITTMTLVVKPSYLPFY